MAWKAIGIFDSGVGGLSVLECFRELCPNERVVYFADTDWFPYGPRPAAEVRKRSFTDIVAAVFDAAPSSTSHAK